MSPRERQAACPYPDEDIYHLDHLMSRKASGPNADSWFTGAPPDAGGFKRSSDSRRVCLSTTSQAHVRAQFGDARDHDDVYASSRYDLLGPLRGEHSFNSEPLFEKISSLSSPPHFDPP
jgi:hypothetical protein